MRFKLGKPGFWQQTLAVVLVYWALMLLEVFTFDGAGKILAIGALMTAALIVLDK